MGDGNRIIIDLLQPDSSYLAVQWLFRKLLAGVYLLANFLHHLEHKETRKLLSLNISFKRFVLLAVSNRQISAHRRYAKYQKDQYGNKHFRSFTSLHFFAIPIILS